LHDHAKFQIYLPNVYNLQDRRRATLIKPIVLQYLKHKEIFMSAYINLKDVQSNNLLNYWFISFLLSTNSYKGDISLDLVWSHNLYDKKGFTLVVSKKMK